MPSSTHLELSPLACSGILTGSPRERGSLRRTCHLLMAAVSLHELPWHAHVSMIDVSDAGRVRNAAGGCKRTLPRMIGRAAALALLEPVPEQALTPWPIRPTKPPVSASTHHSAAPQLTRSSLSITSATTRCSSRDVDWPSCTEGVARGGVRFVGRSDRLHHVQSSDILVYYSTPPNWAPVLDKIAARLCDSGGVLSHVAIVSREYSVPTATVAAHVT